MTRTLFYVLIFFIAAAGLAVVAVTNIVFGYNLSADKKVYELLIPTGSDYNAVKAILARDKVLKNEQYFDLVARVVQYPEKVHPGRYVLTHGMTTKDMVLMLRAGRQTPVKLVINKFRTKAELSGFISHNLEIDSAGLLARLDTTKLLDSLGLTTQSGLAMFVPNTYDFYWNTSAEKFMERMGKEYQKFWNEQRIKAAKEEGLKPLQAIILASIVEEESQNKDERARIAGVYINRFKIGMKLQADPTVKYAVQDFTLRRITGIIMFESPYNTYLYTGLPPGPICTPSVNAIEAVLHAEQHKYLFFCAKYGSEEHYFSETYAQQQQYARQYHKLLNQNNIY